MANEVPKIRLVRCPKCFKLLTEYANVPVYKCGGCDTTLKAKKITEVQKGESSKAPNQIPIREIEQKYDSEENDSANSSQGALTCSTDGYEQDDHAEKSANKRALNGSGSSDEANWHEKGESSLVAGGSRKANGNHERGRDLGYPTHDRRAISERGNFTSPAQKPPVESVQSKPSSPPVSKELDISEKIVRRYANLIGSRGPVKIPDASIISKSQASKTNPANEASGSSNVARENQVSNHTSKEHGSEYQREGLSSSNKGDIMEDVSVNDMNDIESEVHNQTKALSVMSVNENQDISVRESVSLHQDQLAESNVVLQVQNHKDMVGKPLEGGLQFSESSGTKNFHEYHSSFSSDDGVLDSDFQSRKSEESISGSQSVDELTVTNEETTMEDVSTHYRTETTSEMPIIGNHVPVVLDCASLHQDELPQNTELRDQVQDDNVTSEDEMVHDGIGTGLGISKSSDTKIFHEYGHSVSSVSAWEPHVSDIHSHQAHESFSGSQMVDEELMDTHKTIMEDVSVSNKIDTESDVSPLSVNGNVNLQEDELPQKTECGIQDQDYGINSEEEVVCNKIGGDNGASNIPAIKSFHAYDASVSSNDGWGDQVSDFRSHQSKGSFSESQRVADNEAIRGKYNSVNDMIDTEPDMRRPSRKFSLTSVVENHSMYHQDEFPQYSRYQIQVQDQVHSNFSSFKSTQTSFKSTQSWLGVDRERLQTQKYSTERFPRGDYEASAPPPRTYPPSYTLDSVERKQIELLKKVEELSAQLNRSYGHNTRPNPYETYPPSKVTSFQCSYHQMSNCSCSNAYSGHQSLPRSPLPKRYYSEDLGRGYSDHPSYSVYSSDRSTPDPNVQSRCPLREGCLLPYDHIHKPQIVEPREPRERRLKRHYRPIAGGAPFITCYSCKKLLFLPADSFLSNKRLHRLQCGSCSKVLTFSFHGGSLVSPYSRNDVASSSIGSTTTRNSVFTPHPHPHPIDNQGDPLSYSEDHDLSIRESDSTYGDISSDQSRSVNRKQQPFGKLVKQEIKNRTPPKLKPKPKPKPKSSTQATISTISGSPSSNEAESAREEAVFALHRLMGYSTVSKLLRAPSS